MSTALDITYTFQFGNQQTRQFALSLDKDTLTFIRKGGAAPLPWSLLGNNMCGICPLDEKSTEHCPVALNLGDVVETFKDYFSYENVKVTVTTQDRAYAKGTSLQEGLSSLLGIIMVTSGCPVMERLKPMVRFHLPFATLEETVYRMVSMYLVSQLFVKKAGKTPDWDLKGLTKIYADVGAVNRDFSQRLLSAAKKDANINALVNLDCFASMVPLSVESMLEEIRGYFSAYLK